MATLPAEFVELAAELIGDEFEAFATDCAMSKAGAWDDTTQTATQVTQTMPMIRLEFDESQFNGQQIKVGDYLLIGEYANLSWEPSADNTTTTHDSIAGLIKNVATDPAKAAIIIQVRRA